MKKLITAFLLLTSISAFAGWEVGNGGGGVEKDGRYMTFYSAQIPLAGRALDLQEIPGIAPLVRYINSMSLRPETKATLISLIIPNSGRFYYRADDSKIDQGLRSQIVEEYKKAVGLTENQFVLFALTDRRSRSTALLSEFFTLQPAEQSAILLHEALWAEYRRKSYAAVVQTEIAAQAVLENPATATNNQVWSFYKALLSVLEQPFELLSLSVELSRPELNKMPLQAILSPEAFKCITVDYYNPPNVGTNDCTPIVQNNLALLRLDNMDNRFYETLYNILSGVQFVKFSFEKISGDPIPREQLAQKVYLGPIAELAERGVKYFIQDGSGKNIGYLSMQ